MRPSAARRFPVKPGLPGPCASRSLLILFPFGVGCLPRPTGDSCCCPGGQQLAPAHPSQIFHRMRQRPHRSPGDGRGISPPPSPSRSPRERDCAGGPGQGMPAGRIQTLLQLGQAGLQLGLIEAGRHPGSAAAVRQFGQIVLTVGVTARRGHRGAGAGHSTSRAGPHRPTPAGRRRITPGSSDRASAKPCLEPVLNGVERELAGQAALLARG